MKKCRKELEELFGPIEDLHDYSSSCLLSVLLQEAGALSSQRLYRSYYYWNFNLVPSARCSNLAYQKVEDSLGVKLQWEITSFAT